MYCGRLNCGQVEKWSRKIGVGLLAEGFFLPTVANFFGGVHCVPSRVMLAKIFVINAAPRLTNRLLFMELNWYGHEMLVLDETKYLSLAHERESCLARGS